MNIDALVDRIHQTPHRGVILTAGGGSGIFPLLMKRGGASATILDGGVPHGVLAVPRWLKLDLKRPDRFPRAVSSEVARGLAMAAYMHARELDAEGPHFGIGCTVALAKQGAERAEGAERAGREHKVYAAVQTAEMTFEHYYTFPESAPRAQEEEMVERTLLDLVRIACDVPKEPSDIYDLDSDCRFETAKRCGHQLLPALIQRKIEACVFELKSGSHPTQFDNSFNFNHQAILSTSMNPLHPGHRKMRRVTTAMTGRPCHLEMPIRNAAKPPLDYIEIENRLDAVSHGEGDEGFLLLTNRSTFVEKSELFKDCVFAIGYDTAIRIPDPNYYFGGIRERDRAYDELRLNRAKFLVFGRLDDQGVFQNIDPTNPDGFVDQATYDFFSQHSQVVPENEFRQDVSSSEIRKKKQT